MKLFRAGGGDTIASLEAELQAAINGQHFELCGPIRDKINALKNAPPAAESSEALDEDAYAAAVAKIEADMQAVRPSFFTQSHTWC